MPDAAWLELRPAKSSWLPGRSAPRQSLRDAAELALADDERAPLRAWQVAFVPVGELMPLARLLGVPCAGDGAYDARTPGDVFAGFPCVYQGDDDDVPPWQGEGPWLFAVDQPLLVRLQTLDDDELADVAATWARSASLAPEDAVTYLEETRAFLREATRLDHVLYWHEL